MINWESINWDGDPVADAAGAREAWLRRQRNLARGWTLRGHWKPPGDDPAALSRQLDARMDDPVIREERAARARLTGKQAQRILATGRNPDGSPKSGGAALDAMRQLEDLGIGAVGHEPGCRP